MDDYEGAAEMLKLNVKTYAQKNGVLSFPVSKIFLMLVEAEEPDLTGLRKMMEDERKKLMRAYFAAKATLDNPNGQDARIINESIVRLK